MNYVLMEVVLGYRDNHRGPWQRMAQGNITRTLRCHMTEWVSSHGNSLAESRTKFWLPEPKYCVSEHQAYIFSSYPICFPIDSR